MTVPGLIMVLLGITLQSPGKWERERLVLDPILANVPATGLIIFQVVPDSQAESAGLRVGDIITHYDGQPMASHLDLIQQARIAHNDKRPEILLIVHREGNELEVVVSPGPIGVRIEDVEQGESRSVQKPASPPIEQDLEPLRRSLAAGEERWFLIHRPEESAPAGWAHHFLTTDDAGGILRIQQELAMSDSRFLQDVVVHFDLDASLTPREIRVWTNDQLILGVTREGNEFVGTRVGVPVRASVEPGTVSSYLLPYLAETLRGSQPAAREIAYLKPVSIETAPLSRIDYVPPAGERTFPAATLTVFGRRELACRLDSGAVAAMEARDGMSAVRCTKEELLQAFPNAESAFSPIDKLPKLPAGAKGQAN